jgi:hypothetical protein
MGRVLEGLAILILMLPANAAPVSKNEPNLSLTLRMYDYAAVPKDALARAERAITRLLDEAGIQVTVLRCSSSLEQQTPAVCGELLRTTDLVVRIMPGVGPGGKGQLGVSVGAVMATVYYQRAVEFSAEQPASERVATGEILGCGTAHEIGHLLLQSPGHSPAGIMRAGWSTEELKLIWDGRLHFTAAQAEDMREEVRRRIQHSHHP